MADGVRLDHELVPGRATPALVMVAARRMMWLSPKSVTGRLHQAIRRRMMLACSR
jgi:hypothetical protein